MPDITISSQRGVALIMVLWVMVLLAAMVTEFSSSMRVEINSTRNFKEEMESRFLAESGIELAMAEIMEGADFHTLDKRGRLVFARKKKAVEGIEEEQDPAENVIMEVPQREGIPLGAGTVTYRIIDENRRININAASKKTLMAALEESGVSDEDIMEIVSDSILDWIDPNSNHRLNGAEDKYYERLLPDPYLCKNAKIDSMEEMLWIRGVTPELLFGSEYAKERGFGQGLEGYAGIDPLFTAQGTGGLNTNTAPAYVLRVFYPQETVDQIIEQRNDAGWFDLSKSTHFTIYSMGKIDGSRVRRLIVATVELSADKEDRPLILITRWNDNEDPEKYYDLFDQDTQS